MGQKCVSTSLRLGINKPWLSRWNAPDKATTIKWILEDEKIRLFLKKRSESAGVGLIEVERSFNLQNVGECTIFLHVAQIGLIEGNEKEIDFLNKELKKIAGKDVTVKLKVLELKNPGVCADILAHEIAKSLENRMPFRSTMKRVLKRASMAGAKGIKIKITGRLNGAEMARSEGYSEGSIPLSTLRSDIDYCQTIAKTTYGVIGVKVWVNRGVYFGKYFMPLPPAHEYKRTFKNRFISKTY